MRLQQRLISTPPSAPFGAARLATPAAGEWCADRAGTRDRRRKHITLRNQHQRGFGCAPTPERRDTVPVALWDRSSRSVQPDPASRSSVHDRPHRGRSVRLLGEPRLMLMRAFLIFMGASYARRIVTAHADAVCVPERELPGWLCPYKKRSVRSRGAGLQPISATQLPGGARAWLWQMHLFPCMCSFELLRLSVRATPRRGRSGIAGRPSGSHGCRMLRCPFLASQGRAAARWRGYRVRSCNFRSGGP
jgi:hypothetical protein